MMDAAFWYHFAILFEALLAPDGGGCGHPCGALFMLQDFVGRSVAVAETWPRIRCQRTLLRYGIVRAGVQGLPPSGRGRSVGRRY